MSGSGADIDPFPRSILIMAHEIQRESLREDASAYVALTSGTLWRQRIEFVGGVPGAPIFGRITAGLTQKQLAQRLGRKEQQIQRSEATGYRSASIDRVKNVASALGLKIRADVQLPKRLLAS